MIRVAPSAFLLAALASAAFAQPPQAGEAPGEKAAETDSLGDALPVGAVARFGTVRLRHAGDVRLAFTPDGRHLASVGTDEAFQLWDADSGRERRRYTNPSIALSTANEMVMLMARGGRRQVVWNRGGGQTLPATALAFSGNGQWLAALPEPKKAVVWNTATGEELRHFTLQFDAGHSLALSADGTLLAAGDFGEEAYVRIWDRASGRHLVKLKGVTPVNHLLFSPDKQHLAGLEGTELRLWHVPSGKRVRVYQGHSQVIAAVAFSPDGKRLATAAADALRLWETDSEEEIGKLTPGDIPFTAVAFSPDGRSLASGSFDGTVRLWDAATTGERRTLKGHSASVNSLAFSPDGRTLATADAGGMIRLWDAATGKEKALPRLPGTVQRAGFRPGRSVALTTEEGATVVGSWDPVRVVRRQDRPAIKGTFTGSSADGKFQTWTDEKEQFVLWDADKARAVLTVENLAGTVAFSPDGRLLAVAGPEETVRIWRTEAAREVRRLDKVGSVAVLAFSADGKTLATVNGEKGEIALWELASGRLQGRLACPKGTLSCLAFSPDGALLAGGGGDEVVRVWDTLSGRLLRGLVGHRGAVPAVDFCPRGRWLVSGGEDGSVRVWDAATGAEHRRFEGHRGAVQSVLFAPDGRHVVSGSKDATALVWDLEAPGAAPPRDFRKDRQAEPLWSALGDEDAAAAYRAVRELAALRNEVVPFLRERLRPVPRVRDDHLAGLIAGLDDKRYPVREKALRELEKLEGQALAPVRKALEQKPSPETAKRLASLVTRFEEPIVDPQTLRTLRAVVLLERIGTPEACGVLRTLAGGAPGARLTRDAEEAWRRLSQRQGKKPQAAGG